MHLGDRLVRDNTGDLALVVEGEVVLADVKRQGKLVDDEREAETRFNINVQQRLRE